MAKVALEIGLTQIEKIIKQLNERERQNLIQKLVNDEFELVVRKLRRNVRQQGLTPKDIDRIVERARQEYYDRSCR